MSSVMGVAPRFRRYKSTLHCADCGISHPAVLQFHHRNKAEKKMAVSALVSRASSLKQITNEIKKCDMLCANCHAKRHWRETHETDRWEVIVLVTIPVSLYSAGRISLQEIVGEYHLKTLLSPRFKNECAM
jgi:hypothetical protein